MLAKVTSRRQLVIAVFVLKVNFFFPFKIAAKGEGCKPDLDRQRYIAESELALLGILSKQCLMIHFYLDNTDGSGSNKRLIFQMQKALRECGKTR